MFYLEIRGEVPVGLIFICLIQVIFYQSENQVVSVVGFSSHHHHPKVLVRSVGRFPQCSGAAVLQFVWVLLWSWDEEGVDPEVKHLFLVGQKKRGLTGSVVYTAKKCVLQISSSIPEVHQTFHSSRYQIMKL